MSATQSYADIAGKTGNKSSKRRETVATRQDADFEEASRFLCQAGFGGNAADIARVQDMGLEGWFLDQLDQPLEPMLPRFMAAPRPLREYIYPLFWERVVHGEDQLRQRVAYTLSQIIVISVEDAAHWTEPFVDYLDMLQTAAFGNYAELLRSVTYSPAMGIYLTYLGNEKTDPKTGAAPDENYARELMQLFTIGVSPLTEGGEQRSGETFGPDDVAGLAAIMTGLSWAGQDRFRGGRLRDGDPNKLKPMDAYPVAHEDGPKTFLGYTAEGRNPITAIDGALDHLMAHSNTAPFVCKRLIQRMVTSNPSPAYVRRVAAAFLSGQYRLPSGRRVGTGALADMTATVAAILFDTEARSPARFAQPTFGRLREPTLRYAHILRAFRTPWSPPAAPDKRRPQARTFAQTRFGEQPWWGPSVFGSFGPNHAAAGTSMADQGLVLPEMQAMNASTMMGFLGFVIGLVRDESRKETDYDFGPLRRAATNADRLVDLVDETFLHGTMHPDRRTRYIEAISLVSMPTDPERRAKAAQRRTELVIAMIATDAAFAVQQ